MIVSYQLSGFSPPLPAWPDQHLTVPLRLISSVHTPTRWRGRVHASNNMHTISSRNCAASGTLAAPASANA
jgi:hypothetical protein